jgi:hypothetical protein
MEGSFLFSSSFFSRKKFFEIFFQGINYIAGILVLEMEAEQAFWVLVQFMKFFQIEKLYQSGLQGEKIINKL